jgi:hypothetical protein
LHAISLAKLSNGRRLRRIIHIERTVPSIVVASLTEETTVKIRIIALATVLALSTSLAIAPAQAKHRHHHHHG